MLYLSSEYRFHLTKLSVFKKISLWMEAIENIFNHFILTHYCEVIVITVSLFGNTFRWSLVFYRGVFSKQTLAFTISFHHLNYVLFVFF